MADPVVDMSKTYRGENQTYQFNKLIAAYSVSNGSSVTPDTTTVNKTAENSDGYITAAYGDTVPTDAEAGYLQGCIFLNTNPGAGEEALYENVGDETSCAFEKIGEPTETEKIPAVALENFEVQHNADPAGNGHNQIYLFVEKATKRAELRALAQGVAAVKLWEGQNGAKVPINTLVELRAQATFAVQHDADPVANLSAALLYVHPTGRNKIGVLKSVTDGNASTTMTDSNNQSYFVYDDDNAAAGGFAVYIDELTGDFYSNCPHDLFVESKPSFDTEEPNFIQIKGSFDPVGAGYLPVYFDDDAASTNEKLAATFVGAVDVNANTYDFLANGWPTDKWEILPVYYEKGAAYGSQLQHASSEYPHTHLVKGLDNNNLFLPIAYDVDAAINGPAIYFDPLAGADTDIVTNLDAGGIASYLYQHPTLRPYEVIVAA